MTIYLDNMAATPVDPRVAERHRLAMTELPGNAHSAEHAIGIAAQRAIDEAAASLATSIRSDSDQVLFTPGASSALWLVVEDAIGRAGRQAARVAATAAEHPALLSALRRAGEAGRAEVTIIPVDAFGHPRLEAVEAAVAEGVELVCTMAANNEVGTITDVLAVNGIVARGGARHLVDASQAAGRVDPMLFQGADLIVVSGAKAYGPRRAGALIGSVADATRALAHDTFGSPDASAAVALAFALFLRASERTDDEARLGAMRDTLEAMLVELVPDLRVNGAPGGRLGGSLHVSTPHLNGDAVVASLWGRVAISTGAACQSGVPGPSHVLAAMDMPGWALDGAVRIGLGRFNDEGEVLAAGSMIASALGPSKTRRAS